VKRAVQERKHGGAGMAAEKDSEQAALLDKGHDAICVTNMEQQILYWNKGASGFMVGPIKEAVGQMSSICFLRWINPRVGSVEELIRRMNGRVIAQVRKDGRPDYCREPLDALHDDAGQPSPFW